MKSIEIIPTKFPKNDVKMMDILVEKGFFISRSDLIREAARQVMENKKNEKTDFEQAVEVMKKKGDFDSMEGKVLSKIFLDPEKPEKYFNKTEQKTIRRLLRHPFKILRKQQGKIFLTENGQSIAKGYLKGLTHVIR